MDSNLTPPQLDDLRAALGLSEDVLPEHALRRAAEDPLYLHHILIVRESPLLLAKLTDDAMIRTSIERLGIEQTVRAVVKRITQPLIEADENTIEKRLAACRRCPHLAEPPRSLIYRMGAFAGGGKICDICGCFVTFKARLAAATCPDRSPEDPSNSRWEAWPA